MKKIFIIISLLILTTKLSAQENGCNCLGSEEWKSERVVVNSEMESQKPFNSILKVHVKRWYNKGYYGTGSFINNSTIITAHHNLVRKKHISRITYKLNGETIILKKKDFKVYYYQKKLRTNSDIAIIKITNPSKIKEVNNHFEISDEIIVNNNSDIHLTGFPCDYNGNEMLDKQTSSSNLKIDSSNKLIGYPLYTCTGDSGAPLWVFNNNSYYLIGIHHGGNEGNREFQNTSYNISVYINNDVINWINLIK